MRLLLEKGASPNSEDRKGRTPLWWAAGSQRGTTAIVQLLLEKGADVNSQDYNDSTPLEQASKQSNWAIVRLLEEKGAKSNLNPRSYVDRRSITEGWSYGKSRF